MQIAYGLIQTGSQQVLGGIVYTYDVNFYVSGIAYSTFATFERSYDSSYQTVQVIHDWAQAKLGDDSTTCGDMSSHVSLDYEISNNRLVTGSVVVVSGDSLGSYQNSSAVTSDGGAFPLYRQTHYYEFGYVEESFTTVRLKVVDDGGVYRIVTITTYPVLHEFDCSRVYVDHTITDSKEPTDCCLKALCYPDQYYLV